MSTKSSVDLRAELAELVKRKAEIAVSKKYHCILSRNRKKFSNPLFHSFDRSNSIAYISTTIFLSLFG